MSDDPIKSAYELAMEKLAAMDEPTDEEVREYRIKEYRPYGEAIAMKYLDSKINDTEIKTQINEYTGESHAIVKQAFLQTLGNAITLDHVDRSKCAISGAIALLTNLNNATLWSQYNEILTDYYSHQSTVRDDVETALYEQLGLEGISGAAVKPAVKSSKQWKEKDIEIQAKLQDRLGNLRQAILQQS